MAQLARMQIGLMLYHNERLENIVLHNTIAKKLLIYFRN